MGKQDPEKYHHANRIPELNESFNPALRFEIVNQCIDFWPNANISPKDFSEAWFSRRQYGKFELTEACIPFNDHKEHNYGVIPKEGYRIEKYVEGKVELNRLTIAASKEKILATLVKMLDQFDSKKPVVVHIEANHSSFIYNRMKFPKSGLVSAYVELKKFIAICKDHEDLLLSDGAFTLRVSDSESLKHLHRQVALCKEKHLEIVCSDAFKNKFIKSTAKDFVRDKELRVLSDGENALRTDAKYVDQLLEFQKKVKAANY